MVYSATLFNTDPYWDDFNEDKKFLRMLFRPGRAVQARELTQLQTIVQDQIKKMGDHLFKNGSRVLGGELTNQDAIFLRVNPSDPYVSSEAVKIDSLIGTEITTVNADSGDTRKAKVLHGISGSTSNNDNYGLLIVQYMDGGSGSNEQWSENAIVQGVSGSTTYYAKVATSTGKPDTDATNVDGVTGTAKLTTVNNGIFFVEGQFVKGDLQSTSPFSMTGANSDIREFNSPTSRIGFTVSKDIVEHTEDYTLRDPASGSYNYNAPGADRYKIDLKLAFKNFVNDASYGASGFGESDFIDLVRFVDGNLQSTVQYTQYSEIEKTLARRTYDESGSYTTKPFEIDIRESLDVFSQNQGGDESKIAVGMQPGKAYVFGYELETQGTEYVLTDKSRTTESLENQVVQNVKFGNYAKVRAVGAMSLTGGFDVLVDKYPKILLTDSGGKTGTARVRQIVPNNDMPSGITHHDQTYNMYMFDIDLATNGITAFANVTSFGGCGSAAYLGAGSITAGFEVGSGGTVAAGTALFEPGFNSSIFELPVGNSVSTLDSMTYTIYKSFRISASNDTTVHTVSTSSSDMTFVSDFDPVTREITPDSKRQNFTLICGEGGGNAAGRSGERVDTENIQFILSSDSQSIEIGHASTASKQLLEGEYTLLATINSSVRKRSKTRSNAFSETYSQDSGSSCSLSGTTGSYHVPLTKVDIINVSAITDNNGTVQTAGGLPSSDVKSMFLLDNGQKDNYYDFGKLYLKPDLGLDGISGSINLTITYDHFNHQSGEGPFIVDSYTHPTSGFTFENIPIYTSPNTGKSYSLRNCIDFRGTAQSDGTIKPDGLSPKSSSDFRADYSHHLSRIDKIVLTKERKFDVIKGIPALNPITPPDRADAMTLYVITIPSYTYNIDDITTKYVENKRYTMKDIGAIEKRVENLEYYTSLSLLEQQTEARSFIDSGGNDIFKNGIMVDAFRGHSVGDVMNSDYVCSVDYENGHLRPPFTSKSLALGAGSSSGITMSNAGVITLNYDRHSEFVWQPFASDFVKVNPFSVPTFMGYIEFDDPFDNWYDQTNKPTVKINSQGENDRWKTKNESSSYGFGTQWNDWEVLWSGRTVTESDLYNNRGRDFLSDFRTTSLTADIEQRIAVADNSAIRSTETIKNNEGRSGIRLRRLPERLEKLVNNRIVDVSVVPYMRSKTVTFSAYGMKPNTTVYPYFDGQNVAAHCGPNGGVSGDALSTGTAGQIENAFFSIPENTYKAGEKLFRLTDSSTDTLSETTTAADGIYYSQGIVEQYDGTLVSTRPFVSRRQVVNDNSIVRDAFDRDVYIATNSNNLWLDPLSQSFTVNSNSYPDGVFLDSVDLFFQRRDETVPITLEIRPTINGYPHLSKVVPFSSVSLVPPSSEIRSDYPEDTTFTRFQFDTPVHLTPGEYAFCLRTSSQEYNLFRATIGEFDLNNGGVISEQPHDGSLYIPQNTGIATENQSDSLKYKINICKFGTSGNVSFEIPSSEFTNEIGSSGITSDVVKFVSGEHTPRNSTLSHSLVKLGSGIANVDVISNENLYLDSAQRLTSTSDFELNSVLTSTNQWVSPVIDTKRLDFVSVSNTVNNSTDTTKNGELNANANSSDESLYDGGNDAAGSASRYITRRVTLADGFESSNFKVLMSVNKPAEATVQVFIKALSDEDDTPFEDVTYTQMTADATIPNAANNFDFNDVTFSLSSNFDKPIKTFAVKVCLYSSSSTKVPSVRDFRTIALNG